MRDTTHEEHDAVRELDYLELSGVDLVLRFTWICGWHGQASLARGCRRSGTGQQVCPCHPTTNRRFNWIHPL